MSTIRSILLVDDNRATNFLHVRTLRKSGLVENVHTAHNGQEALEYLTTEVNGSYPRPDLIFLDINMPTMNGWEFLSAYRRLPLEQRGNIVVVMLTTSLNPDDMQRARSIEEVNEYAQKPLTPETLMEIVGKYFARA